ncbi:MAG: type I 3-dehydroquinate dehydratase [Candidatus Bathyarchaeota archaeon]|nr:type I 3-dehydroquinate dehydratase [Candidatus Bathyarchaeota archaeon]
MTVQVCVAVPPKTVTEALDLIKQAEAQHADLIEIRLDSLTSFDGIEKLASATEIPLIATNRPKDFGGNFSGTETERQQILFTAAKSGFEYVDVDLGTKNQAELVATLHDLGTKVIISFHDFARTPSLHILHNVLEAQIIACADVCKIVTTATTMDDNIVTLNLVTRGSKKTNVVCFAMGELGTPSRLLSAVFGGIFTFACLDEKRKTAKGQLTIHEMKQTYALLGLQ